MTKDGFKNRKIEGRERVLNKIIETFKALDPVAIHQFGSGKDGYRDEFSDIDLIITFEDDKIDKVVAQRDEILKTIEPVLLKSESAKNSPIGGKNI